MLYVLAISFGLVFIRALGTIITCPVLGEPEYSWRVHALLAALLAVAMFPVARVEAAAVRFDLLLLLLLSLREFAIGAGIGLVLATIYSSFRLAGQAAGHTMGIRIANVLDPLRDEEYSLVGEFWYFLALAVFVAVDGHLYAVEALERSFQAAPVAHLSLGAAGIAQVGIEAFQTMFIFAVRLALPVVGIVVLAVWGMGLLGRMVPQMHVFIVGFPLMLLAGIVGLYLALPVSAYVSDELMREAGRLWDGWLNAF